MAKFIGRSNVITGKSAEVSAKLVLVSLFEGQKVACALDSGSRVPVAGEDISLCIKPEAVSPVVRGNDADLSENRNSLPCRLESSSYQGSLADLRLSLAGSTII